MGRAVRSPVSLLGMGCLCTRPPMALWHDEDVRLLDVAQLGDRYRRYRFTDPDAETAMAGSLRRYGQLSPLVVCLREETHEVLDGFKRLAAARALGLKTLRARLLEADERMAKAAIYGLNDTGRRPQEWEEAGTRAGSAGGWLWSRSWPGKLAKTCAWGCSPPRSRGRWCGCRPATRARC